MTNSTSQVVYHNTIANSGFWQAMVSGTIDVRWSGRWKVTGNYWSNYEGADSDQDGIGDTAHPIYAGQEDKNPVMSPYFPGDFNHDGKVDMADIAVVAIAYGSYGPDHLYPSSQPHPKWNPKSRFG